ncbi:hypothetical protein F4703DRAFT_1730264, partial [Phycomyces blakesleeanus]
KKDLFISYRDFHTRLEALGVSVCRMKFFSYVDKLDFNFFKTTHKLRLNQNSLKQYFYGQNVTPIGLMINGKALFGWISQNSV